MNQSAMASRLGVSREWLSRLETGSEEVSEIVQIKARELERETGQSGAQKRTSPSPAVELPATPSSSEPTREDCLGYLAGYLDEAAGVPGAVGYVWIQLNTHLPRDLLRRLKPAAAGPPASGAALAALGFSPEEIRRARRDADEALRRTDAAAAAPRDERRHA
jgi:transcriptional regulator with XRE-family HTH domain